MEPLPQSLPVVALESLRSRGSKASRKDEQVGAVLSGIGSMIACCRTPAFGPQTLFIFNRVTGDSSKYPVLIYLYLPNYLSIKRLHDW